MFDFVYIFLFFSGSEVSIDDTQFIVSEIIGNKNTADTFLSLYIEEGRFYSTDGNINWRLQIWQDVINNSIKNDLYIFGFGFQEILPAMDDPSRKGYDGSNENVHNIYKYLRQRRIVLLLFDFLYYFSKYKQKNLGLLLFNLIVSTFDVHGKSSFPNCFLFFYWLFFKYF